MVQYLNVPSVVIAKIKLLKPVKEVLLWVKLSVRIKFKLSDKTVPEFPMSLAKFVTSIVTIRINRCTTIIGKVISCYNSKAIRINRCTVAKVSSGLDL